MNMLSAVMHVMERNVTKIIKPFFRVSVVKANNIFFVYFRFGMKGYERREMVLKYMR